MTALIMLVVATSFGLLAAAWLAGHIAGHQAGVEATEAIHRADQEAWARLAEEIMPPRACLQWTQAAARGRARVSTGSGRLVVMGRGGAQLVRQCPWCGARLAYTVGGQELLTPTGRAHAEVARQRGEA